MLTDSPYSLTDYNCSWDGDPPEIEPNGDISGPGVLVGFLGPAYFVVLVILVYYFVSFDPTRNPFQFHPDQSERRAGDAWRLNPVDAGLLRFLRSHILRFGKWTVASDRIKPQLEQKFRHVSLILPLLSLANILRNKFVMCLLVLTFCQCILNFCDLQIITGIGILVSGFYCIQDISAYHWQIIVYLAWFASITHITTLTFLRDYLNSRKDLQERNLRIFTMLVFLILLLVAEFPTGFFNWPNKDAPEAQVANASSYAKCFFDIEVARQRYMARGDYCYTDSCEWYHTPRARFQDTTAFQGMIVSVILLVFNFGSRVVKFSMTLSSIFNHKVRASISNWFRYSIILRSVYPKRARTSPHWPENKRAYIITRPLMALFLLARLYLDLGTSTLAEVSTRSIDVTKCKQLTFLIQVYWLIVSTIWGSLHLFMAKNSRKVDDGSITFGQVLPVVLLIAPLLPMVVALVQLHRDDSPSSLGGLHSFEERDHGTSSVNSALEQPRPSSERESQPQWLIKSYYEKPWMKPAITIAVAQVLYLTITILQLLANNTSAVKTLASRLIWIFILQPASCFFVILLGLAAGTHSPQRRSRCHVSRTCLSWTYWLSAAIIYIGFSLSHVWLPNSLLFRFRDPVEDNEIYVYVHIPLAGGIMFLYCIVCFVMIRPPADDSETTDRSSYMLS